MQDYSVALTNTSGVAFPATTAINATGPSTTDGTEFVKALIDDNWGRAQAIMNHAGLTPDGVTEADGTAQIIEALQKGFGGAPGFPMEWNLVADPGTTGHRCLLLQGQGILHASYPDLLAAVYVGDGNNAAVAAAGGAYYKATDAAGASPSTSGTYLIMPDARGVTTRGLDAAATIDPDGASRFLGDIQADDAQVPAHNHLSGVGIELPGSSIYADNATDVPGIATQKVDIVAGVPTSQGTTSTDTAGSGTETRMYNRSTRFVIWY